MQRESNIQNSLVQMVRTQMTDRYTFGRMLVRDETGTTVLGFRNIYTLELPWRNNQKQVSCIPPGRYELEWYPSTRHGMRYLLRDVPNRAGILVHPGNFVYNSRGCILLGLGTRKSFGYQMVSDSRRAVELFEHWCHSMHDPVLEIINRA